MQRNIAPLGRGTRFSLLRRRLPPYCCCFTSWQESMSPALSRTHRCCLANDSIRIDITMPPASSTALFQRFRAATFSS